MGYSQAITHRESLMKSILWTAISLLSLSCGNEDKSADFPPTPSADIFSIQDTKPEAGTSLRTANYENFLQGLAASEPYWGVELALIPAKLAFHAALAQKVVTASEEGHPQKSFDLQIGAITYTGTLIATEVTSIDGWQVTWQFYVSNSANSDKFLWFEGSTDSRETKEAGDFLLYRQEDSSEGASYRYSYEHSKLEAGDYQMSFHKLKDFSGSWQSDYAKDAYVERQSSNGMIFLKIESNPADAATEAISWHASLGHGQFTNEEAESLCWDEQKQDKPCS